MKNKSYAMKIEEYFGDSSNCQSLFEIEDKKCICLLERITGGTTPTSYTATQNLARTMVKELGFKVPFRVSVEEE